MKKIFLILMTVLALFVIVSCGSKDTEYYVNHPEEMKKKIAECREMSPAEVMADKECSTAMNAGGRRMLDMDPPKESPLKGKGRGQGFKKF